MYMHYKNYQNIYNALFRRKSWKNFFSKSLQIFYTLDNRSGLMIIFYVYIRKF